MQKNIRLNSDLIFAFIITFHFVCYGLDAVATKFELANYYGLNFELLENIVDLSILLLIWGYAENWGFFGKRCLTTMMMLAFLNIIDSVFYLSSYYFIFLLILILNFMTALAYKLWKR